MVSVVEVLVVIQYVRCTSLRCGYTQEVYGIKGSRFKVMKSFICEGCLNPVTSTGRRSVDIGASANLGVDKICYFGD